jgi:hypothetical protein
MNEKFSIAFSKIHKKPEKHKKIGKWKIFSFDKNKLAKKNFQRFPIHKTKSFVICDNKTNYKIVQIKRESFAQYVWKIG